MEGFKSLRRTRSLHAACGLGRDDKVEDWGSSRQEGQVAEKKRDPSTRPAALVGMTKVEYWGSDRLEGQPVRILSGKGNTLSFCILNSAF